MPLNHIGGKRHATAGDASGVWHVKEVRDEILDGVWPNKLEVKVGSFTKINVTGTQSITGVGFKPKAIIFFTTGSDQASGTADSIIMQSVGFTTGTSNSYSSSGSSRHGVATSDTGRRMAAKAITIDWRAGVEIAEADLSSLDTGGFTLNWTTNGATMNNMAIGYIALGGDIQAKVVPWNIPGTVSNKSVTGVGFQPDLVFHTTSHATTGTTEPATTTDAYSLLGTMNSAGEQWSVAVGARGVVSPSDTSRAQRNNRCIYGVTGGETVISECSYLSMDTDGFTVTENLAGSTYRIYSLCIKGVRSKLATFDKSTGAAPANQSVATVGFKPKLVGFAHAMRTTAGTTPVAEAAMGMGAYDGTSQVGFQQYDLDAVNPTQTNSLWHSDRAILMNDSAAGAAKAALTSLDTGGFSMTWNPNTGSGYAMPYFAIAPQG